MTTYRTTLSPQDFAVAAERLGFQYLETSCFCTTYARGNDLLSIEEPDTEVYEDLEIATDFKLSPSELVVLQAWHN